MSGADLNVGFKNNKNIVTIRQEGSTLARYTDRTIDLDGDGVKEKVTETYVSGDASQIGGGVIKVNTVVPSGFSRTEIFQTFETDLGVAIKPSVYTEGIR